MMPSELATRFQSMMVVLCSGVQVNWVRAISITKYSNRSRVLKRFCKWQKRPINDMKIDEILMDGSRLITNDSVICSNCVYITHTAAYIQWKFKHTPNKTVQITNGDLTRDKFTFLFSIKRPFYWINEMYTHSTASKPAEIERAFRIMSNGGRWRIDNEMITYQMLRKWRYSCKFSRLSRQSRTVLFCIQKKPHKNRIVLFIYIEEENIHMKDVEKKLLTQRI